MFSYYGAKTRIAHLYPKPANDLIIEPFAGSARYALKYFERNVILIDKFSQIVEVWKYLQNASEKDILSLPDVFTGESLNGEKFKTLSRAEKLLIGFQIARGNYCAVNKAQKFNSWKNDKIKIARQLFKIRHWKIQLGDYFEAPNVKATWFIDPPYLNGGVKYKYGSDILDFETLKTWINAREGQTIVCENAASTWMDFKPLAKNHGSKNTKTEGFWTNLNTEAQLDLFSL